MVLHVYTCTVPTTIHTGSNLLVPCTPMNRTLDLRGLACGLVDGMSKTLQILKSDTDATVSSLNLSHDARGVLQLREWPFCYKNAQKYGKCTFLVRRGFPE